MLKILSLLSLLLLSGSAYAEQAAPSTLAEAQALVEQGRAVDAIAILQQLVDHHPDSFQAWFLLGVTEARERRFHDAIESFNKVIALQPKLAEPHNNLAVIYNELGNFRAAVKELEASLKLKPDYPTAQENIGDLYVKLAADAYRKALARDARPVLRQRYERLLHIRDIHHDKSLPVKQGVQIAAMNTALKSARPPAAPHQVQQQEPPTETQQNVAQKNVVKTGVAQKDSGKETVVQPAVEKKPATTARKSDKIVHPQGDAIQSAIAAVEAWRVAWNGQNLAAYFSAYGAEFDYGARFKSLAQWRDYKRWAITKRTFIRVTLENIEAKQLPGGDIRLIFLQHFRSESYRSDDIKQLVLQQTENGWKIIREISK